ncbi:MAG: hypothetical protein JW910_13145 [Anaerolineae bacterium]|nr:hypothetical protein [Anaerolineae bacterium]
MPKHLAVWGLLMILILVGCMPHVTVVTVTPGGEAAAVSVPTATGTTAPPLPTDTPPPTATPLPPTETPVPPTETPAPTEDTGAATAPLTLITDRGEFFVGSGLCAVCHANMTDEAGNDVSLDRMWRSTMMANSARDPYWQAGLRREVETNPDYAEFIQDKCATCHMPMARFTAHVSEQPGLVFDEGNFLDPANPLHNLAMDSTSCSLCHQITPEGFGELASFSGHYDINTTIPMGERPAYGQFTVTDSQAIIMQASSGLVPTQSEHVTESELCATCHTLYTPTIDAEGEVVGEFPEQMPYLEWLHSSYVETDSCQDCHMPTAEGGVVLSVTGGELRSPFFEHVFVGGNIYLPRVFQQFGDELNVVSSDDQFATTLAAAYAQLETNTATVSVDAVALTEDGLAVDLTVTNLAGHKLPTSYPSRRVWLHVTVTAGDGAVVFESGGWNAGGSITGNANDSDENAFEPHYQVISAPDEVQIYEALMHDAAGNFTTTLLSGAGYSKDNRLLPDGFDPAAAPADVAVYGAAADDPDFLGGSDHIRYEVATGSAAGPFTVSVELLYQSISYRWAMNLRQIDAFETNRFLRYYDAVPNTPVVLATAEMAVEP